MTDKNLYNTFEQDTKNFINQINSCLIALENNGYSVDEINQVFRCIHSIKSEASYLNLKEIAEKAHQMESVIEPLRNVGTDVEVDPALLEFCYSTIDAIGTLVEKHLNNPGSTPSDNDENFEAHLEELDPEISSETDASADVLKLPYNDFELMLLTEARGRGEHLYSLSFAVSDEESMKYPRAYLALSNLEQGMNVIKYKPEVEELDQSEDGRMTILLTSSQSEAEVAAEINIDQIINIEINELSFDEELKNEPLEDVLTAEKVEPAADAAFQRNDILRDRVVSVEADDIDALSEYVSEIKKRLSDLSSAVDNSSDDKLNYDFAGIETISDSIEKMMSNLQTVDFNTHFAGYKRTVRDLSTQLGKKAELVFNEDNIRIPREFADFLAEPMLQIIRNAVVHGIEEPSKRISEGKNENGIITVKALRDGSSTVIVISDDGSGIDEDSVFSASDSNEDKTADLIDVICRPGFTTLSESGPFAGRGVGLDLVKNRISKRRGKLEIKNDEGLGCEFKITVAASSETVDFVVVDSDNIICAVEKEKDSEILKFKTEEVKCSDGSCSFNGKPLFTANGRFSPEPELQKKDLQALKLKSNGSSALLVINESLFEVSYQKDTISIGESTGKYTRKFLVNGSETDYYILSPEVIFD